MLRSAVIGMLLGKINDSGLIREEKADAFVIVSISASATFVILSKLRADQHIRITPVAATFDKNRLLSWLHIRTELLLEPRKHFGLKVFDAIWYVGIRFVEARFCAGFQIGEIRVERLIQAHHNVNVAILPDIRIVPIRTLQEDRILLRVIRG